LTKIDPAKTTLAGSDQNYATLLFLVHPYHCNN